METDLKKCAQKLVDQLSEKCIENEECPICGKPLYDDGILFHNEDCGLDELEYSLKLTNR